MGELYRRARNAGAQVGPDVSQGRGVPMIIDMTFGSISAAEGTPQRARDDIIARVGFTRATEIYGIVRVSALSETTYARYASVGTAEAYVVYAAGESSSQIMKGWRVPDHS